MHFHPVTLRDADFDRRERILTLVRSATSPTKIELFPCHTLYYCQVSVYLTKSDKNIETYSFVKQIKRGNEK